LTIKTFGLALKIRVGRVSGNTSILSFALTCVVLSFDIIVHRINFYYIVGIIIALKCA